MDAMKTNSEVLVSVVIPVYNAEKYLPQCLDSVVDQTLRNIEIICVDDGSTDGSLKILEEYAAKDPRITILRQENQYAGAARNNGMAHAHGKYLVFWDADDYFDVCTLKKLTETAERYDAQICVCGARLYDEQTKETLPTNRFMLYRRVPREQPFNKKTIGKYLYNFGSCVPWNKLFRRAFVEQEGIRFQLSKQVNDLYFVMISLFRAERITAIEDVLITYRVFNPDSLTGKSAATGRCMFDAINSVYDELSGDPDFTDEIRQSLANKSIGPLMDALRMLNSGEDAEKLYEYYRAQLFPKLGLYDRDREFFNSDIDYDRFRVIPQMDCRSFMLFELRSAHRRLDEADGRLKKKQRELAGVRKEMNSYKETFAYKLYRFCRRAKRVLTGRKDG